MKITKISDLVNDKVTALIYAPPGAGKTSLLGNLPGKTLIIDVDKGTSVLVGQKNDISIIRLDDNLTEFFGILDKLEKSCPFNNVCLDSLSELEKSMLTILGRDGKNMGAPVLLDYNRVQFKLTDICRRIRNLNCNVIFTAWESNEEIIDASGQKYTRAKPMLSGKTSETICGLCDIVGRIVIDHETEERFVMLSEKQSAFGKDRVHKRKSCKFNELII